MDKLELTSWQRYRLRSQLRQVDEARVFRRTLAVLEASRGKSVAEISAMLGVSRQSVYRWIEAYRQSREPTALWEGEHPGRPSFWDGERQALLRCLLEHQPDQCGYFAVNWTVPLLKEQLECSTGLSVSDDTIRREMRRLGYVWKRGRYELAPDPELEKKTTDSEADPQFAAPNRTLGGG